MEARVQKILEAVRQAGGRVYAVGGAVRDQFLNVPAKDTDLLVTGVPVERLMEVLPGRVDAVGKSFGVLKVSIDGEIIDVALPRTERSTGVGHRDFVVTADPSLPVEADLARRDFTMNAIAVDLETGAVVDPFEGREDINDRVIRTVGRAAERFSEDPLRMLRAMRFVSKLRFGLHGELVGAVEAHASLIQTVSAERIGEEMGRLLMGPKGSFVVRALRQMISTGLMQHVIPEFMLSVGFEQRNHHHFLTVENHVLMALEHAIERGATLRARWAVFLHDIAKPATFSLDEEGRGHFYDHEDKGAVMATEILGRLKLSNEMVEGVSKIVAEHLRPQTDSTDRVLRRYVARMGELTEDGITCREADLYAHKGYQETAQAIFEGFRERIVALKEIQGFTQASLALRGDEIATEFQVVGKGIGELKKKATAAVIDGLVANERAALLAWLRAN
jgi:tRNA nucleotidyltransferase (CCA-adding enzyme)